MRYAKLYAKMQSLPHIEQSEEEHARLVGLDREKDWEALLPPFDGFVPTNFPNINALVQAHSPVIKYISDKNSSAHTTYDRVTQKVWIELPPPDAFVSPEFYARVVVHELSHWVKWQADDVVRGLKNYPKGSFPQPTVNDTFQMIMGGDALGPYALEEMIAETTALLLIRTLAPDVDIEMSVLYLHVWGENMREYGYTDEDVEKVVIVSQDVAHKAAAYLLQPLNLEPVESIP